MNHVAQVMETGSASPYWCAALALLHESGVQVSVLVTGMDEGLGAVARRLGVPFTTLGASSSRDYPATAWRIRRWVERQRPDLLHVHEAIPWALVRAAFPRRHPVPVILHRHHIRHRGIQDVLSRAGSRAADRMFVVSSAAGRAAVDEGVPEDLIDVAWNGVPPLRATNELEVAALRDDLGIHQRSCVLVLVARLRPEKGHDVALAARALLARTRNEPVHLVLVGDGVLRDRLERAAASVREVHVIGYAEDVAPWYALADVVIVPSRSEPFGLVAIEALSAGRPLVVSSTGGLREIVRPNIDGLVAPAGNPSAFAAQVGRLLDDNTLARRLSETGRGRYLDNFTAEAMVRTWIDGYGRTLSSGAKKPRPAGGGPIGPLGRQEDEGGE